MFFLGCFWYFLTPKSLNLHVVERAEGEGGYIRIALNFEKYVFFVYTAYLPCLYMP